MRQFERRVNPANEVGARRASLRLVFDLIIRAADEAPGRDSELALRAAAAEVGNALTYELRRAMI